jgi:hypothetical protein
MDQSKKTMRHFYCRDVLWETFEQMARELECSVDYLVNEAMKQYARQRGWRRRLVTKAECSTSSTARALPPNSK